MERKSGSLEAELRLRIFMDAYGQRVTGMCTSAMCHVIAVQDVCVYEYVTVIVQYVLSEE